MPRRNHKATRAAFDADQLAASIADLATILSISDGKFPCAGCRRRGHWNGAYCEPCKGRLILDARTHILTRR
jgi:hypothetical protein